MNIMSRKVQRFRCHIEPGIGPMPKNAFDCRDSSFEAELTPYGVYVKVLKDGSEHLVPYANLQSVKLLPQANPDVKEKK